MSDRLVSDVVDGLLGGQVPADLSAEEVEAMLDVATEFQPLHRAAAIRQALGAGSGLLVDRLRESLAGFEPWAIDDEVLEVGSRPAETLDFQTPDLTGGLEPAIDDVLDVGADLDFGSGLDLGSGENDFDLFEEPDPESFEVEAVDVDRDLDLDLVESPSDDTPFDELDLDYGAVDDMDDDFGDFGDGHDPHPADPHGHDVI